MAIGAESGVATGPIPGRADERKATDWRGPEQAKNTDPKRCVV